MKFTQCLKYWQGCSKTGSTTAEKPCRRRLSKLFLWLIYLQMQVDAREGVSLTLSWLIVSQEKMQTFAVSNCCMDMSLSLLLQVHQVWPSPCSALMERDSHPHCPSKAHGLCAAQVTWGISKDTPLPLLAIYSEAPLRGSQGSTALHRIPHEEQSASLDTNFNFRQIGTSTRLGTWMVVAEQICQLKPEILFHGISPDPRFCNYKCSFAPHG